MHLLAHSVKNVADVNLFVPWCWCHSYRLKSRAIFLTCCDGEKSSSGTCDLTSTVVCITCSALLDDRPQGQCSKYKEYIGFHCDDDLFNMEWGYGRNEERCWYCCWFFSPWEGASYTCTLRSRSHGFNVVRYLFLSPQSDIAIHFLHLLP